MPDKKFPVVKVFTSAGTYYSRDHVGKLPQGSDLEIHRIEVLSMTEGEYQSIPASLEAKKFFNGDAVGTRPE